MKYNFCPRPCCQSVNDLNAANDVNNDDATTVAVLVGSCDLVSGSVRGDIDKDKP